MSAVPWRTAAGTKTPRCGTRQPTSNPPGCWKGHSVQSCDSARRGQQSILKENMRKLSVAYSGRSRSPASSGGGGSAAAAATWASKHRGTGVGG